ncbi:hypothetical protein [Enterobacter cloacae]|uniref:hypothetical protein n=1 Tax=Enterobacter cloacae TaxID=550 RepID=UPI0024685ABD|nr:hypothetical protein [Enterobacter cloacae]WGL83530.1 hypothetical protein QFB83_06895 [Enterobacter cloacae]
MALKHRELNELDGFELLIAKAVEEAAEVDESEVFDESEEIDDSEGLDEDLKARRKANIQYQNARKEKLKKLGEHQIQIRLDDENFQRLCDLCEVLGYRKPKKGMYNLVETYSAIFKYLLRTSEENFEYIPSTKRSIKILSIYKYVDHLRNEQQLTKDIIISELRKKNAKIPVRKSGNGTIIFGKGEFLERYFDKVEVIRALKIADKK